MAGDLSVGSLLGSGAFVVMVLREVFNFLGTKTKRNGNGNSGEKPPEYWTQAFEIVFERVLARRNVLLREMMRDVVREVMNETSRKKYGNSPE